MSLIVTQDGYVAVNTCCVRSYRVVKVEAPVETSDSADVPDAVPVAEAPAVYQIIAVYDVDGSTRVVYEGSERTCLEAFSKLVPRVADHRSKENDLLGAPPNRGFANLDDAEDEANYEKPHVSSAEIEDVVEYVVRRVVEAFSRLVPRVADSRIAEAESFPSSTPERIRELKAMDYKSEYLKTPEWEEKGEIMRRRFGNRCQTCNSNEKKLEVHHRTYERVGEELPADPTLLCEECHDLIGPVEKRERAKGS